VLAAALSIPSLPRSAVASGPYSVPPVAYVTAVLDEQQLACIMRSDQSGGNDFNVTMPCYTSFAPDPFPPPPPPPYEPPPNLVFNTTLNQTTGQLTANVLPCTEITTGVLAVKVASTVQLDKAGGNATGTMTLIVDWTPPLDCADGTDAATGPLTLEPLALDYDNDWQTEPPTGDGCPDYEELGPNQGLGGLRDPFNPWDYFNPTHDGENRTDDILMVVNQYHKDDNDANPGLPPYEPGYNPDTDRTYVGPNAWNLGPPNGQQRTDDILAEVAQYHHDCS